MILLITRSAYSWQCSVDIPYEPIYTPRGRSGGGVRHHLTQLEAASIKRR
jgi:hypothetical protein